MTSDQEEERKEDNDTTDNGGGDDTVKDTPLPPMYFMKSTNYAIITACTVYVIKTLIELFCCGGCTP